MIRCGLGWMARAVFLGACGAVLVVSYREWRSTLESVANGTTGRP